MLPNNILCAILIKQSRISSAEMLANLQQQQDLRQRYPLLWLSKVNAPLVGKALYISMMSSEDPIQIACPALPPHPAASFFLLRQYTIALKKQV